MCMCRSIHRPSESRQRTFLTLKEVIKTHVGYAGASSQPQVTSGTAGRNRQQHVTVRQSNEVAPAKMAAAAQRLQPRKQSAAMGIGCGGAGQLGSGSGPQQTPYVGSTHFPVGTFVTPSSVKRVATAALPNDEQNLQAAGWELLIPRDPRKQHPGPMNDGRIPAANPQGVAPPGTVTSLPTMIHRMYACAVTWVRPHEVDGSVTAVVAALILQPWWFLWFQDYADSCTFQ